MSKTITLFRIEHPKTGHGMFSNHDTFVDNFELRTIQDNLRHNLIRQPEEQIPVPAQEFSELYGFNNMSDMRNNLYKLKEKDYDLYLKFDDMSLNSNTMYACDSLEKLKHWIDVKDSIDHLDKLGYELHQITLNVEDCIVLPKQVMYNSVKVIVRRKLHLKAKLTALIKTVVGT